MCRDEQPVRSAVSSCAKATEGILRHSAGWLRHPWLTRSDGWWAQMDLNHRPRAYQARALTN